MSIGHMKQAPMAEEGASQPAAAAEGISTAKHPQSSCEGCLVGSRKGFLLSVKAFTMVTVLKRKCAASGGT